MSNILEEAKRVFEIESKTIKNLENLLTKDFEDAIKAIIASKGRLVISGMGKSGHIGVKISATLASTGTPSFFMHPAEAMHGDLGMLTSDDIVLAISNSGESEEIVRIIPPVKRMGILLIGMAGNTKSTLAKESDYFLNISIEEEACPLQLAPTSSTTATLAMGDALSVALMKERNFQPEDFAMFHPGGSLGKKLLTKVKDVMHNKNLPIVNEDSPFDEIINVMTTGRLGLAIVLNSEKIVGIITDGDLRRSLGETNRPRVELKAKDIMTKDPKSISSEEMAIVAEKLMIEDKINDLLVIDNEKLLGVIQIFDTGEI